MSGDGFLRHPLLDALGVAHGFGTRAGAPPAGLLRPVQVHGARVAVIARAGPAPTAPGEADAVVSARSGLPVGVVTADCVPVLLATPSGVVGAVHAGWRGLAAGVVGRALEALAALAEDAAAAVAVIGPHVLRDCYEVDAPVVDALARFGPLRDAALVASRPGHWRLDLARLVRADLETGGIAAARIADLPGACTVCDAERFHSHRRDGAGAGRLHHWVVAGRTAAGGGAAADS